MPCSAKTTSADYINYDCGIAGCPEHSIDLNVDYLKRNYQMVHYFGLGFIQLKLTNSHRMHFYTNVLPPTIGEEVHNHRYSFRSYILKGTLRQEFFQITEGSGFVCTKVSCQKGGSPFPGEFQCDLELTNDFHLNERSNYRIHHNQFHRVSSNYCITSVHKGVAVKQDADVVYRLGSPRTCPFAKQIPEPELWEIIRGML